MTQQDRDKSNHIEALLAGQPIFSIEILPSTRMENIRSVGSYGGPVHIFGNPSKHTLWNMRREGLYKIRRDLRLGMVSLKVSVEQDIFGYIRVNSYYKRN
ncbi:MAG: hypothetical protein ACP5N7_03270 [Candidatus Pacearchaeota archaeon]